MPLKRQRSSTSKSTIILKPSPRVLSKLDDVVSFCRRQIKKKNPVREPAVQFTDGYEEYKVEAILSHRKQRGKIQYLVKWKGYHDHENTWQSRKDLQTPEKFCKNTTHRGDAYLRGEKCGVCHSLNLRRLSLPLDLR